jgi:hypothetical protein
MHALAGAVQRRVFVSGVLVSFAAVAQPLMISADPSFKGRRILFIFHDSDSGTSRTSIVKK